MTVPVLLLSAIFAVQPQDVPVATTAPRTSPALTVSFDAQRQRASEQKERPNGERPHQVGVGGQMGMSNRGGGAGMRYFMSRRLGVNFNVGWFRGPRYTTINGTTQSSTFAAVPSFMFMLTTPDPTRNVDIRPYVGGGINYVRSSQPVTTTVGTLNQERSGTGAQAFGGVEMTFREADFITISAEGIYYKLPIHYVNSAVVGGFNYLLAFHFYLK